MNGNFGGEPNNNKITVDYSGFTGQQLRRAIKLRARDTVVKSDPPAARAASLYVILCFIVYLLTLKLTGWNVSESQLQNYLNLYEGGQLEEALNYIFSLAPNPTVFELLLDIALRLMKVIVFSGLLIFLFNLIDGRKAEIGNLLDGFGCAFRVLAVLFLKYLLVIIGLMFFIVPGLIIFYMYRISLYLAIERSDMGIIACLSNSRKFMSGYKKAYFSFDMSMILYRILGMISTVGFIAKLWFTPYVETAEMLFYRYVMDRNREKENWYSIQ